MVSMKFLVVGCGSIGQRHIRNLRELGEKEIIGCDIDQDKLSEIEQKYGVMETFIDFKQALKKKPEAVLVCTSNVSHVPTALTAVENNCHVFVEKPLSHNLDGVDKLIERASEKGVVLMVGFNLRFHPNLLRIKDLLDERSIGKVICARAEIGQYLPEWHPWEDYRKSYSAQKALGGGIVLDAVHELDYIRWFLGEVREVFCLAGKLSNLEIDTEDIAEVLLRFKNETIAEVHMDYIQRSYSRSCQIIGDKGTILWDFNKSTVKLYSIENKQWQNFVERNFDFNRTYLNEIRHFIKCIRDGEKPPVDGKEGKRVLEMALAAKRSAETNEVIEL